MNPNCRKRVLSWSLLLGVNALVACGGGDAQPVPAEEVIDQVELGVETQNDRPVAAAIQVDASGAQWVFSVDSSNRLWRGVATPYTTPPLGHWAFGAWQTFYNVTGVPTVAPFKCYPSVFVIGFVRRTDGRLWQFTYPNLNSAPDWYDISTTSGFGNINGSPAIVEVGNYTCEISVAVRSTSDELYTLDFTPSSGWSYRKVLNVGSTPIKTTNTFTGTSFDSNDTGGGFVAIAGRGLTASDDTTNWVAKRPHHQFTTSFSKITTFNGGSTPAVYNSSNHTHVIARFGTQLKRMNLADPTVWTVQNGCSVSGSPTKGYAWTWFRNPNGQLNRDFRCEFPLGGSVNSAPADAPNGTTQTFGQLVYYKGSNGRLWVYKSLISQHMDVGVVLP